MAGWHSLSGYLHFRSGGGISLLKSKRRLWCVLEESQCQLLYYKSETEVHKNRSPLGHVSLKGAAISLDLDNHNQFIILSDNKEYIFTAENHESMMIWLIGLQNKRDVSGSEVINTTEKEEDPRRDRPRRVSDVSRISPVNLSAASVSRRKLNWQGKATESLDTGIGLYRSKGEQEHEEPSRSRSLPPVFEAYDSQTDVIDRDAMECPKISPAKSHTKLNFSKSYDNHKISKDLSRNLDCRRRKMSAVETLLNKKIAGVQEDQSSSGDDSDEVFGEMMNSTPMKNGDDKRPYLNKLDTIESVGSFDLPSCDQSEQREIGSSSSLSVSSDSAIDKGETSSAELASRLTDLEKELISTKCELAKVMNRQSSYQELLAQRDDAIRFLEGRLDTSGSGELTRTLSLKSSKTIAVKCDKDLQERLRVLQNQNRFLNEEVKKLAKLRQTDRSTFYLQEEKIRALEANIEKWKLDYVSLIQSSIRFPGGDTMDDAELVLFGGDRHQKKVKGLLEEARKINPGLPTYESLANGEVHVDNYGFKHEFEECTNGLLLHYLCQELTLHYLMQAGTYEEHQKSWTQFMRQHGKSITGRLKELKLLCRGGIPDRFRKQIWRQLVYHQVREIIEEKGQHYYRNLCNMLPDSPLAACYRKQISLDLMRTMPSNTKFSTQGCKGIMDLQDVLLAYCIHNPTVGYCQGMNFIVGMALLFMDAQDAFWTLVAVSERFFPSHYFDHSLIGAQSDQKVLKDILAEKLPRLHQHLEENDIEISTVTLNWFLAIFFDAVPFQTLLRIWDCFLVEGPKVLFRFAMAILKIHEKEILMKVDTISIMRHLKAAAKLTFDVDGLLKVAFEDIKPFPRRHDIASKQACYLNALKEKHKKKELQRMAFAEREHMYMAMEAESGNFMNIGSAVVTEEGKVWLCYGDQNTGKMCKVTCEEGLMYDLALEFDSRVMCMFTANENVVLVGTLSWMLYAYSSKSRENLWQMQLHDAVLSLCCYDDEDTMTTRTFAGLADGTLAVMEHNDVSKIAKNSDVMYIPIGQAPVASLLLIDQHLWCASGNTVYIIHARTLDTMDNFNVSINPYDHILSMVPGNHGIWITLRGSSILELWDPKTLNCKLLYDTRTDRYPQMRKEDDTYFNRSRITAVMDLGHTVWVGTGEGNLIIYEVQEHINLKTPTDLSPSVECTPTLNSSNHLSPRSRKRHLATNDKAFPKSKSTPASLEKPSLLCENYSELNCNVKEDSNTKEGKPEVLKFKNLDYLVTQNGLKADKRNPSANSETASTGTITPRNLSPMLYNSDQKSENVVNGYRSVESDCTERGNRVGVLDSNHGNVDLLAGEKLIGSIDVDTDEGSFVEDGHDLDTNEGQGRRVSLEKSGSSDGNNDQLKEESSEITNKSDDNERKNKKRTKAVRPTDLIVSNTKSRQSARKTKKNITNKEDFDTFIKQLNGVSKNLHPQNGDLDIGYAKLSKSCECLNSERLCRKNVEAYGKEECSIRKNIESRNGIRLKSKSSTDFEEYDRMSREKMTVMSTILDDSLSCNNKVMSRHHKVNSWLSKLSQSQSFESLIDDVIDVDSCRTDHTMPALNDSQDGHGAETEIHQNCDLDVKSHNSAPKQSSTESEDTFFNADEDLPSSQSSRHSNRRDKLQDQTNLDKTNDKSKEKNTILEVKRKLFDRQGTVDSLISIDSQDFGKKEVAVSKSNDPEVKYRLEFSGMQVETDTDEPRRRLSEMSLMSKKSDSPDDNQYPRIDSKLCEQMSKVDGLPLNSSHGNTSADASDPKLLELMQTPSLMSRHISVGRVSRELINLNDICSQSSASPRSSVDQRVADFLRTPSLSSRPSSVWSSFENISTPSAKDDDFDCMGKRFATLNNIISHNASSNSLYSMADALCVVELVLQAKVKITDKPVRAFLKTRNCGKPCILSFSGCYGDDEAVLKWRREPNEKLWTNEPILEICPKTKVTKLPSYMRGRLSSNSSQASTKSFHSASSQPR